MAARVKQQEKKKSWSFAQAFGFVGLVVGFVGLCAAAPVAFCIGLGMYVVSAIAIEISDNRRSQQATQPATTTTEQEAVAASRRSRQSRQQARGMTARTNLLAQQRAGSVRQSLRESQVFASRPQHRRLRQVRAQVRQERYMRQS